jgi:hypothetical protein
MRSVSVIVAVVATIALLSATAASGQESSWDMNNCTFTTGGKTFDFSPLFASNGSYTWTQTLYTADPSNDLDSDPASPVTLTFELQVCGNVKSRHAGCTIPSPANMIQSNGTCTPLGDSTVSAFDVNPYADGAYLTYYHGASVNHIQHYLARIYFVCDPTHFGTPLYLEHLKNNLFQTHFKYYTPLAC